MVLRPVRAPRGPRALLTALVGAVLLTLGSPAAVAATSSTPVPAVPSPPPAAQPVVLVGVGGLRWDDVDRSGTPTLWRMVDEGSVGSVSVHTSADRMCPVDGWLTVSAGRRLPPVVRPDAPGPADDAPGGQVDEGVVDACPSVPEVGPGGTPGPAGVTGWAELVDPPADDVPPGAYGTPGTVARLVAATQVCTTAVGPGAALALADEQGALARYAQRLGALADDALRACPVTVLDGGELPADRADRRTALSRLDDDLRRVLAAVEPGTRVVVAGTSDGSAEEAGLLAVVQWDAGGGTVGWLTSDSTRRTGIVTLTDLAATLADAAGADTSELDGAPLRVGPERRMTADRTVENRRYQTELTTVAPHLLPLLLGVVGGACLLVVAAVAVLRRRHRRPPPALRGVTVAVLLLGACAPVGALLAALSRWWGSPAPLFAAAAWWGVATVTVAVAAWGVSRLLPSSRWRLATGAAGVAWAVVTVDGVTGTVLQQGSVLGISTLGARYYGFGNTTFGVYAAAGLVLAAGLAASAVDRGRRRLAVGAVAAVGLVSVVVDGWPAFGADFGGVLALVPAFAVLLVGVSGGVVGVRRVLAYLGVAVGVVAIVSVVDWAQPGRGSHLGQFVQRVLDGDAFDVVAGKAAGAWATVAQPLGVLAALVCLAVCAVLVGPDRWRPSPLRDLYTTWPLLRRTMLAVVVVALLGSLLNDSGVVVATAVLAVAGTLLLASVAQHRWEPLPDDPAAVRAPVHRMPAVVVATGGGIVATLLLATVVVPLPVAVAGDVTRSSGAAAVPADAPLVLVGTSGVDWARVDRTITPTLWGLLRDGAPAGGVTPGVSGRNAQCPAGGWLALSSGRAAVAGQLVGARWQCVLPQVTPAPGGEATVAGWDDLVALQSRSEFRPRLGALGAGLASADGCSTAVGEGAALALAAPDGTVARYRTLEEALDDPQDAFACPTTVVDAGSGRPREIATSLLLVPEGVDAGAPDGAPDGDAPEDEVPDDAGRDGDADTLQRLDRTIGQVLRAVPDDATVLVVDTGRASSGPAVLGVGIGDPATGAGYLGTTSTRWVGVFRLLDLPVDLLDHAGARVSDDFAGAPVRVDGSRPAAVATTVRQLADLSVRDQALRGTAGTATTPALVVALLVVVAALWLGPRLARTRPARAERLRRVADALLLTLAALPVGLFLMTTTSWWRFADPDRTMWLALAGATAAVAGVAALMPRRPLTLGPGVVAGVTFVVLTLDAVLGTPLHRGSPQGPAVTLGGRFYGFGNPTYSFYVVAALATAAIVGWALVQRGRRTLGTVAAALVCGVALVVDLWPALGADIGGGLVLVPASLVVVLGVAGVRTTWQRLLGAGAAGVALVGAIAVLDWLRPAAERTHLGVFVQRVVDGSAWETVARKLGYAAATVTSGWVAALTLVVLVLVALLLWPRSRVRLTAWDRLERRWPPARPFLVGMLLAGIGGGLVNDYGVRIATVMLLAAVPLVGTLGLRALADDYPASAPVPASAPEPEPAPEPVPARRPDGTDAREPA
ncbi:conserved hypothetical protein [Cellulomonas flavigena DSM 20109]|uniref:Uncharacterized protein n=1 Tax=Cellulomonas flavigena (strain ATCC 482 / DSM 20109 / BCRC 11376 / JCM 18109 / NBRC 3775 / NCIMB 8073 / NRS 134) TaxID=446466 RepID=D5ULW4_CELFN|nr:hypothetical protein [Cellulomonas flavigena]ADG76070.1 conserved hypothetical protein [Cellulomonas flavigena DSM 20109]